MGPRKERCKNNACACVCRIQLESMKTLRTTKDGKRMVCEGGRMLREESKIGGVNNGICERGVVRMSLLANFG